MISNENLKCIGSQIKIQVKALKYTNSYIFMRNFFFLRKRWEFISLKYLLFVLRKKNIFYIETCQHDSLISLIVYINFILGVFTHTYKYTQFNKFKSV